MPLTPGRVYAATVRELQATGSLDTWQGYALLHLALRIDSPCSASALVALSREFRAELREMPKARPPDESLRRHRLAGTGPWQGLPVLQEGAPADHEGAPSDQ